jgi:copper oxidase (laccase) domain-containing protein
MPIELPVKYKQYQQFVKIMISQISAKEIYTTCRNEEFFSYRKEGIGCGRMMSVMMLR